jgi:hypothetical protein
MFGKPARMSPMLSLVTPLFLTFGMRIHTLLNSIVPLPTQTLHVELCGTTYRPSQWTRRCDHGFLEKKTKSGLD